MSTELSSEAEAEAVDVSVKVWLSRYGLKSLSSISMKVNHMNVIKEDVLPYMKAFYRMPQTSKRLSFVFHEFALTHFLHLLLQRAFLVWQWTNCQYFLKCCYQQKHHSVLSKQSWHQTPNGFQVEIGCLMPFLPSHRDSCHLCSLDGTIKYPQRVL